MAISDRSRCYECGGAGQVLCRSTDSYSPDVWDVCEACEAQWCRDTRCTLPDGSLVRHLKHTIRERSAA